MVLQALTRQSFRRLRHPGAAYAAGQPVGAAPAQPQAAAAAASWQTASYHRGTASHRPASSFALGGAAAAAAAAASALAFAASSAEASLTEQKPSDDPPPAGPTPTPTPGVDGPANPRSAPGMLGVDGEDDGGMPDDATLKKKVTTVTKTVTTTTTTTKVRESEADTPDAEAPPAAPSAVRGYGMSQYNANKPIEDKAASVHEDELFVGAVLDGHGGWEVAEFISSRMTAEVQTQLKEADAWVGPSAEAVEKKVGAALDAAFVNLDNQWIELVRQFFNQGFTHVAKVGSCGVVLVVRPDKVVCANAGDCRAVLARKEPGIGKRKRETVAAVPLSIDHNCRDPREQVALFKAHPGEEDVVLCASPNVCYVKGRLQPTRGFGDLFLKSAEFNNDPTRKGGVMMPEPFSPPYIQVSPEVTIVERTEKDQFVVVGSDGLWDFMSNEEAIAFVSERLSKTAKGKKVQEVADALLEEVLARAADDYGMTVHALKKLPPGRRRRTKHDDITVMIVAL